MAIMKVYQDPGPHARINLGGVNKLWIRLSRVPFFDDPKVDLNQRGG